MLPREFRLYLGSGIVAAAAVLTCGYLLLNESVRARLPREVCIQAGEPDALCYSQPDTLVRGKTTAIAVSSDGRRLASTTYKTIQVWNLETEGLERSLPGHTDWITALAISPDGNLLASSSLDGTIRLWELETGTLVSSLKSGRVTCLKFSPDGQLLATGSRLARWADGQTSPTGVQLWGLATKQVIYTLGTAPIVTLAFSGDGQYLASGAKNTQLWDLETGTLLHTLDSGELTSLVFTPDSNILITGSTRIRTWDAQSGTILQNFSSGAADLAITRDGTTLVAAVGGTINFWHLETDRYIGTLRSSWYSGLFVAFGLDSRAVISGGSEGVKIWHPREL